MLKRKSKTELLSAVYFERLNEGCYMLCASLRDTGSGASYSNGSYVTATALNAIATVAPLRTVRVTHLQCGEATLRCRSLHSRVRMCMCAVGPWSCSRALISPLPVALHCFRSQAFSMCQRSPVRPHPGTATSQHLRKRQHLARRSARPFRSPRHLPRPRRSPCRDPLCPLTSCRVAPF